MKKIPTMFVRVFDGHKIVDITNDFTSDICKEALEKGIPTVKYDGTCCYIDKDGRLYARFDAKQGRKIPDGAIPCDVPDPVTGHWPHWVPCDSDPVKYKWHIKAFEKLFDPEFGSTYEAIGKHFNGNPYDMDEDILVKHGADEILCSEKLRSFDEIKEFLQNHNIEGIVYWLNGEPVCKIKRTDFGFEWNPSSKKRK